MAQSALSGTDTARLRAYQYIDNLMLFVTPLETVVSGTITAISNKYPTVALTVSWAGSTSAVAVGQYFRIYNGSTIVSNGIIRKAVSGSNCYISETPLGAFGFATNIESAITTGMTIVIYSHHAMFSLNSRISNKVFYKYWDVPYTNQNEIEAPVANTGEWQGKRLAQGETTARFILPRDGNNISWRLGNEFLAGGSYEWELPTGVSFVTGYDGSEDVIEVDAEAGSHLIKLTVFNAGQSHTAYCWVFVSDGTSGLDLNEVYGIEPPQDNHSLALKGRDVSFTLYGENLDSVLYVGAGVLLKENAVYDGESLTEGVGIDSFVGYITELNLEHDGNIGKATFKVVSPMILAQQIIQPSQRLSLVNEAASWNQMESVLANVRGFVYYLIKWTLPALMDMHDLDVPYAYESHVRRVLEVNNRSLQANLQTVADYISGNIGSASHGATVIRRFPQYMSNSERNAIANITTFLDTDIRAPLTYFKRFYNPTGEVRGGAFIDGGTGKPKAAYGARRWGQGAGSSEMTNFVVTPTQGEAEIKARVGHYMAEQNAAIPEMGVDMLRNQDVIDPVYLCWYNLTVSSDYDPLGVGLSAVRFFATEVAREWSLENGDLRKRIRLIGQRETFGQAGEILPIANANGLSQGGYSIGSPVIFAPNVSSGMFGGAQRAMLAIALNEEGQCAITFNYQSPEPSWAFLNSGTDDLPIHDFDFDFGSAFFASGQNPAAALGLYAVTADAGDATVWYFPDILRSNLAQELETYNLPDGTITNAARIKCSETYPDLVIAVFKDGTGTRYGRSTDGGSTWGSLSRVGNAITDISDNDNAPIGLAVFGQYQFVSAPNSSAEYGVYRATTAAGSFTKMTASQDSGAPHPMINEGIENEDYLYVSQWDVMPYSNDFSGGDAFTYGACYTGGYLVPTWARVLDSVCFTLPSTSPWVYDGIVAGGNPGNCIKYSVNNAGASDIFSFLFDWTSTGLDCHDFSMDVKFSTGIVSRTLRIGGTAVDSAPIILEDQNQWHHVRARDFGIATNYPLTGGQLPFDFRIPSGSTGTCEVYIDNITFWLGDGYKLWRVEDATGTPNWVNITPGTNKAPDKPFGLSVDILDNEAIQFVSAITNSWYASSNAGDSWTTVDASSDYRTFYQKSENMLLGGEEVIGISFDEGDDIADIEGDLDNLWDGLGTIKKLLAL